MLRVIPIYDDSGNHIATFTVAPVGSRINFRLEHIPNDTVISVESPNSLEVTKTLATLGAAYAFMAEDFARIPNVSFTDLRTNLTTVIEVLTHIITAIEDTHEPPTKNPFVG